MRSQNILRKGKQRDNNTLQTDPRAARFLETMMFAAARLTCDESKTYIVEVPELLTGTECSQLIHRIESLSPRVAPINTARGPKVSTDIRNNERVRMRFAPHADGSFVRNEQEKSFYSFLVYLNEDFDGGETTFFTEPEVSIKPQIGAGLLFQHPLLHEGSIVNSGTKYVARSDIMYKKPS